MKNMKIRIMVLTDIPYLVKLVNGERAVEDYPGEYSDKYFKKMFRDKETIVYIALVGNEVVGFQEFSVDKIQKRIFLQTITVSSKHRGKGIARDLIRKVEDYAKKKKIVRISTLVKDWNKSMNGLAHKLGYKKKDKFIFWDKEIS